MSSSRYLTIVLIVIGLLQILMNLVPPQVMNYLTSLFKENKTTDVSDIYFVIGVFFVSLAGVAASQLLYNYLRMIVVNEKTRVSIRNVLNRVLRAQPDFFQKNNSSKLCNILVAEIRQAESFFLKVRANLPVSLLGLLVFGYVIFYGLDPSTPVVGKYLPTEFAQKGNWFLASIILLLSPLSAFFLLFDKKIQRDSKLAKDVRDRIYSTTSETFEGVSEIRNHDAFNYFMDNIRVKFNEYLRSDTHVRKTNILINGIKPIVQAFSAVILLGFGARLCLGPLHILDIVIPSISWGDYLGFFGMTKAVNFYVKNISDQIFHWRLTKQTLERVAKLKTTPIEFDTADEKGHIFSGLVPMAFDDVSLHSSDGQPMLSNVNFQVKPHEHIAVFGPMGSGASKLVGLMLGELVQSSGSLRLGENPLTQYTYSSLTFEIGQVRQRPTLFKMSVRDNITLPLKRDSDLEADGQGASDDTDRTIDARLCEIIKKVDLQDDLIKIALDAPLGNHFQNQSHIRQLEKLRNRLQTVLQAECGSKIEFFDSGQILNSASVMENICFEQPLPRENANKMNPIATENLYKMLLGSELLEALLTLGYITFRNDKRLAMSVHSESPKLHKLLSSVPEIGSNLDCTIADIPKMQIKDRLLLLNIALQMPMVYACNQVRITGSFTEQILRLRKHTLATAANITSPCSFSQIDFGTSQLTLRELLVGGRVSFIIHRAQSDVDAVITSEIKRQGLLDNFLLYGADNPIGAEGTSLSESQSIKVAIARILIKAPKIVLLDDALNSLEEMTRYKLQQMLRDEFKDRALISISNKATLARNFDRILVFDRGQVIQEGTYDSLIVREGLYRDCLINEGVCDLPPVEVLESAAEIKKRKHSAAPGSDSSEIERILSLSPLFSELTHEELSLVSRSAVVKTCPSGTVLFNRGDKGDVLYAVLEGSVNFYPEINPDAQTEVMDTLGSGNIFGELAVFGDVVRTLSARTAEDTTLILLEKEGLVDLIDIKPEIAVSLLKTVSRRLAQTRDQLFAVQN